MAWTILDNELIARITAEKTAYDYLVLEPHPDFEGQWLVHCLNPGFIFDFKEILGSFRALSPSQLGKFLEMAELLNYKVAFEEDPTQILEAYRHLDEVPDIRLSSQFPGTIRGLLPFQVQGYNFLKDLDAGVALWSTGLGKSVLISALLKFQMPNLDRAFVLCKSHNCINMQRMIRRLAGLEGEVVNGTKAQRKNFYSRAPDLIILNYEKLRTDYEEITPLVENQRIAFHWDEMPTKLKNRKTMLYKSVCKILYHGRTPNWDKRRPKELRQYMYSATPIENDPNDFFNCLRLLDPRILGSITEFYNEFVAQWDYFNAGRPVAWHNLERLGAKTAHVVHQINKNDSDIKAQFPDVIEENLIIDWNEKDRVIYDRVAEAARTKISEREDFQHSEVLALISVMQMLCNAPSMVNDSAALREVYETALEDVGDEAKPQGSLAAWELLKTLGETLEDGRHTKLDVLAQLLDDHRDEKMVLFTTYNQTLLPKLSKFLDECGASHVVYAGNPKQKQEAQDKFTDDPSIQVFLSSDAGSDSINLEVASVCCSFDLPWKYSTLIQRQNRVHRITSTFNKVRYYRLLMADSIEEKKLKIIQRKHAYQKAIFEKSGELSVSSRLTKQDLLDLLS